jgi:hypothetical protein
MMRASEHVAAPVVHDNVFPMLLMWAARFATTEREASILAGRTLEAAPYRLLQLPPMPINKAMFCVMHSIVLSDMKQDAKEAARRWDHNK